MSREKRTSEPVFNSKKLGLSSDLLKEYLDGLVQQNEAHLVQIEPSPRRNHFKDKRSVEFIFAMCDTLGVSADVRYAAADLFDKFMSLHVTSIFDHVRTAATAAGSGPDVETKWRNVQKRIESQATLRVMSCIQLASKLSSHYRALTMPRLRLQLDELGHPYTINAVLQSEVRVLTTTGFDVNATSAFLCAEALLEAIGRCMAGVDVEAMHRICTHLFDVVYLQWDDVYRELASRSSKSSAHSDGRLQEDTMWLAAAVVGSSSFFHDQAASDEIVDHVSRHSNIASEDIVEFSAVLVGFVLH